VIVTTHHPLGLPSESTLPSQRRVILSWQTRLPIADETSGGVEGRARLEDLEVYSSSSSRLRLVLIVPNIVLDDSRILTGAYA
jgi:hypothetical protein